MSKLALTLLFFVILSATFFKPCYAPFPEDHPYHFLNPWIESWWNDLTEEEQDTIYGYWEEVSIIYL